MDFNFTVYSSVNSINNIFLSIFFLFDSLHCYLC